MTSTDRPLRDYFEQVFRPDRLEGKNQRYVDTYPRAIDWLEVALGRPATLADLTGPNIRRTMRTVRDNGNRSFWVDKMRTRLSSLWKHAHKAGLVDNYQRVGMIDLGNRHRYLERPPTPDSVRGYFMDQYRLRLRPGSRKHVEAAAKALDHFRDEYVRLADVDEDLVRQFGQWLAKQNKTPATIARYTCAIRRIVHRWDRSKFPPAAPNASDPIPAPAPGTLRHFWEAVYRPQRMLDATDEHIDQARRVLRRLRTHYGRDVRLDELTDDLAADHFAWLRDQGLSAVSINSAHRATIFAAWRYAVELGRVDRDPRIRKLKEHRHAPDAWELADVRQLLDATSVMNGRHWLGPVDLGAFWRALLWVEYYTGVRRRTLFAIRQADVDLETGRIYLRPETMKNRQGQRTRIGADALEAVSAIWQPTRELLFPWPYRIETIWDHFRKIQKAAGIPDSALSKGRFHKLRRTTATHAAINAGLPAAIALMGHSGADVTRRYIDPSKMPGTDPTEFLPSLEDLGGATA